MRNRSAERFGLQSKGIGFFWGVPLDKLVRFTISWLGVSVLGMLRFEPFQPQWEQKSYRPLPDWGRQWLI